MTRPCESTNTPGPLISLLSRCGLVRRWAANDDGASVLFQLHVEIEAVATGSRGGSSHQTLRAFLLLLAVDAHAQPLEAPGDGQFLLELGHLGAQRRQIVELALQVGFLHLQALQLLEEKLAVPL